MGWTSPRNTFVKTWRTTNESSKSMVERIMEFKNYALVCIAARLCDAIHTAMLLVISELGLGIATCMESSSSVWLRDSEVPRDQPHWRMAWRRFERHATVTASHCEHFPQHGKNLYYIALLSSARWKHIIVCVDWTDPTPSLFYLHTQCKGQRQRSGARYASRGGQSRGRPA